MKNSIVSTRELNYKLKYLQLMIFVWLAEKANKELKIRLTDNPLDQEYLFGDFCARPITDNIIKLVESLISKPDCYDLNYTFNQEKEYQMIMSQIHDIGGQSNNIERIETIRMLKNIINNPAPMISEDMSLLTMLLDTEYFYTDMRYLVVSLINSSDKLITTLGNKENTEKFYSKLFDNEHNRLETQSDRYTNKLIQTFFKSSNISEYLKQGAIEYFISTGLKEKDNLKFISNILKIEEIKDLDFSKSLEMTMNLGNEVVANYISTYLVKQDSKPPTGSILEKKIP